MVLTHLRLNMLSSPVVRGEDLAFSEQGVQKTMRSVLAAFVECV